MINKELAWFLAPIVALLSQIGGTWWKPARRLGIPIALVLTLIWLKIMLWRAITCGFCVFIGACLPITIGGDSIKKWWQFAWLFVLGYILGLSSIFLSYQSWLLALVPCLTFGILGTLSNHDKTAKFVPWKLFEAVSWIAVIYPYILLATTN